MLIVLFKLYPKMVVSLLGHFWLFLICGVQVDVDVGWRLDTHVATLFANPAQSMSRSFITDGMSLTLVGGLGRLRMITLRVWHAERLALTAFRTLFRVPTKHDDPIFPNGIGSNREIGRLLHLILRLENYQLAIFWRTTNRAIGGLQINEFLTSLVKSACFMALIFSLGAPSHGGGGVAGHLIKRIFISLLILHSLRTAE